METKNILINPACPKCGKEMQLLSTGYYTQVYRCKDCFVYKSNEMPKSRKQASLQQEVTT